MGFSGRSCIGIYIDWPEAGAYYHDMIYEMDIAAAELDMDLLVFASRGVSLTDLPGINAGSIVFDYLESDVLDGLIIISGHEWVIQKFDLIKNKPIVSMGESINDLACVLIESKPGFDSLLNHLFEIHKYKNPLFISGPVAIKDAEDRLSCFKEALKRYNISDIDNRIYYGKYLRQDGEEAVNYFYDVKKYNPDVIVCANDGMAIGAYQALIKRGLLIPDNVAITGFDDIPLFKWYAGPLTTVRQPLKSFVKETVTILNDMIKRKKRYINNIVKLPSESVIRSSCGCKRNVIDWQRQSLPLPKSVAETFNMNETERIAEFLLQNEALENIAKLDREIFIDAKLSDFSRDYIRDWRLNGHPENEKELIQQFNIKTMYITVFKDEKSGLNGESKLMIAWKDGERLNIDEDGIIFPTRQIMLEQYLPDHRFTMIVNALADSQDNLGLVFMEFGASGNNTYEKFRNRLSESMQSVKIARQLKALNEEIEIARKRLEELSLTDELTGLYNRRGFMTIASQQIVYSRRQSEAFYILYIDLDGLKVINDTWGHDEGDYAIKILASIIKKSFRASDVVARLGGDEFTVLSSNTPPRTNTLIMNRLKTLLDETNLSLSKPWKLSMSIGSFFSDIDCTLSIEEMLHLADHKLYEEKRKKKLND